MVNIDKAEESKERDASRDIDDKENMDRLLPIKVPLRAVLAQKQVDMDEVLSLHSGVVIELDKYLEESMFLCVGDEIVAEGETVKVDDQFGFQISSIVSKERKKQILEKLKGDD